MAKHRVTCYIQVAPEWYEGVNDQGERALYAVRPVRMTARQPENPISGAVVVPVTLWMDEALFGPVDGVHVEVTADPDAGVST